MPDQDFAAALEALRLDVGLSLRDLVRLTGIPRSTLSDALAGRRTPRLETTLAVVRACGADPKPWRARWSVMIRSQRLAAGGAQADPAAAGTSSEVGGDGSLATGIAAPGIAALGNTGPGIAAPGFAEPGFAEPGFAEPGFAERGFAEPESGAHGGPASRATAAGAAEAIGAAGAAEAAQAAEPGQAAVPRGTSPAQPGQPGVPGSPSAQLAPASLPQSAQVRPASASPAAPVSTQIPALPSTQDAASAESTALTSASAPDVPSRLPVLPSPLPPSPSLARLFTHVPAPSAPSAPSALPTPQWPPSPPSLSRPSTPAPVPAQLPRDIGGFASREQELARLGRGGVTVIHGRPGVGKTALAVRWSHSAAHRFPDGQLFLDLRGHHPTLGPMPAAEAMGRLLGSLGVQWAPLTQDPDEGVGLWRSALAARRLLIVLDDAISAEQVRPLLPGASGCAVVVTSRHYLADLVVRDGADGVVLDVLPPESSAALLSRVVGAARVEAEPGAVSAVAAACGHLPLALRLAGAMLAGAPERRFAELAAEFAAGDRLTALEGLVRPSAVEDAFELSYRALPQQAGFLFRRLGLHPGPDISVPAAALLADLKPAATRSLLHSLAEAHMIEPVRTGRYRMHDLLRDYATRLVGASDAESEREAARRRLFDWYADRALAVSATLGRGHEHVYVDDTEYSSWQPSDEEATAWLEAEHRNIVAVIEYDARRGSGRSAWTLIDLVTDVLTRRRETVDLTVAVEAGLDAARRRADARAEAGMHLRRGWLRWHAGQGPAAEADFTRARTMFREAGARRGEAAALRGMATRAADTVRPAEARRYGEAALAIYRAEGHLSGQARTLNSLAVSATRSADFTAVERFLGESLALHRAAGNRGYAALALANSAHVCLIRGAAVRALAYALDAIPDAHEIGDAASEMTGLINASLAYQQLGQPEEGRSRAEAALALAGATGYQLGEAVALSALATGSRSPDPAVARSLHAEAVRITAAAGVLPMEAEILVRAARDLYTDAVESPSVGEEGFLTAREAAQRAFDLGLASEGPHAQAEALSLLAACELGLGKLADALGKASRAVDMHAASGARGAEVAARCVLAHALAQDGDLPGSAAQRRAAQAVLDELDLPAAAPLRRLLDDSGGPLPRFA